jgi:hypothetical protein
MLAKKAGMEDIGEFFIKKLDINGFLQVVPISHHYKGKPQP